MIDLEDLYFEWLLGRLDPDGVTEGVAYVCGLLHNCEFKRRVGNDLNRASKGIEIRGEFLLAFDESDFDPRITNNLMMQKCSWFEMLVALARDLDFLYDGGVDSRFGEMLYNMQIVGLIEHDPYEHGPQESMDRRLVEMVTDRIDNSIFEPDGTGGIFPLSRPGHPDQREVEIWGQVGTYFNEQLEGV